LAVFWREDALQGALENLRITDRSRGWVVTHDPLPANQHDQTQLPQYFKKPRRGDPRRSRTDSAGFLLHRHRPLSRKKVTTTWILFPCGGQMTMGIDAPKTLKQTSSFSSGCMGAKRVRGFQESDWRLARSPGKPRRQDLGRSPNPKKGSTLLCICGKVEKYEDDWGMPPPIEVPLWKEVRRSARLTREAF